MKPLEIAPSIAPLHYRPDIDGLRAIAVLAVVIYHANPGALRGGFVGVDIFFVISGYLITGIILADLHAGRFSLLGFYARRIRRLFPALILVLLSVWIAGWAFLLIDEFRMLGRHIAAGAAFVPNIVYWREFGYFDQESSRKVLLHLWSLGVEEQYYLVWPLLLLLLARKSVALRLVAGLIALSFAANLYFTSQSPQTAFYLPFPRFWELLIGSFLAFTANAEYRKHIGGRWKSLLTLATPHASPRANEIKAALGLLLVIVAIFEISRWRAFPGFWAAMPAAGAALLIASGPATRINRTLLSNRLMVTIGLISYPLYLWHWPLLSFAENLRGYDLSKLERFLIVLPAFPLAWLTYRFVERPIRFGKGERSLGPKSIALFSAMVGVAALGIWTYSNNGFPSRFPPGIRAVLQYEHIVETSYRYGKCFLEQSRREKPAFDAGCVETPAPNESYRPLILLWGDSHAAHLYPGFRHLQAKLDFRLGQLTGCAPFDQPRMSEQCRQANAAIENRIAEDPPEVVVLAMRWSQQPDLESALRARIEFLRARKVKEIVLVGPPPQWRPDLKGALAQNYFLNGKVESRMRFGLTRFGTLTTQDELLARIAGDLKIRYISPLKSLCDENGCPTIVDDAPFAIDGDHFSDAGSIYFAESAATTIAAALSEVRR